MATKQEREKVAKQVEAALAPGQDDGAASVPPAEAVTAQAASPHVDDRAARPHVVHLTPRVRPGRRVVTLSAPAGGFTFRRGEGGDLEHVINLTPPQARQLRGEGWIVLAKE